MMTEKRLRVAVLGCGGIARFHVEGLAKAGAEIAWAVDVRPEAAKPWADQYGAKYASDYRAALDDRSVDAVTVTSPSRFHHEMALAALAAGKGVIVEKTLTTCPEDSLEVVKAARKAGRPCFTAYMKRFFPALQKARELMPSLGRLVSVHARSWQPAGGVWTVPLESGGKPSFVVENYGGGVLVCGGSHILDLLLWLCGRPVKLWATQYSRTGADHDLRHTALMSLPESGQAAGAPISFEACWHPLRGVGYQKNGWDERLEINGLDGRLDVATVTWNNPESAPVLLVHYDNATGQAHEYRFPEANSFHLEMAYFADCLRKGVQGYPSAADGYAVDEVIAHIARSARTGEALAVTYRD